MPRTEQSICGRARVRKPPNGRKSHARPAATTCKDLQEAGVRLRWTRLIVAGHPNMEVDVSLLGRIARRQRFRPLGSIYDRPREPKLLHLGNQCCALYAKLRGSAIRASDHPSMVFQRAENQIAFDLF